MARDAINDKPKKPIRKTPSWGTWKLRPNCSLKDAVALACNIHPAALRKKDVIGPDERRIYLTRLKTAGLEIFSGGPIKVIKGHRNNRKDLNSVIISLDSFVSYAMSKKRWLKTLPPEFIKLKDVHNENLPDAQDRDDGKMATGRKSGFTSKGKDMHKATNEFVAALIKLLVEISHRAQLESGMKFDVTAIPGKKKDLLDLAIKFDAIFELYTLRSFDDYLANLCQFKGDSGGAAFYKKIFPEYFK